jgi:hypothetical protein
MASTKSGLTKAQETALEYLYRNDSRDFPTNFSGTTVKPYRMLHGKELVERQDGHKLGRGSYITYALSERGLTLAESLFGSPDPAPTDSTDSSTPDNGSAGDTVAATALTDDLLTASREQWNKRTESLIADSTPAPLYDIPLTPVAPATDDQIADALLPFAEGMDGSEYLRPTFQWTHNANDMPRPVATDWRSCHQVAWLFAEREGVTGHGRTSRNRENANKGRKRNAKRVNDTTVMMERNATKQAEIRAKYAERERTVTPVTRKRRSILNIQQQIAILDALGIGRAA